MPGFPLRVTHWNTVVNMSVVQGASSSADGRSHACEAQRRRADEARDVGTSTWYTANDGTERSHSRTGSSARNTDSSDRGTASTAEAKLRLGRRRQRSIIHPHKGFGGF